MKKKRRKRGRPKSNVKGHVVTLRFAPEMKKWLDDWAREHAPHFGGEPNVSEAIRMAVNICMLVDSDAENTEIINHEFAGDYRMLILRAVQDYRQQYLEANALDISEETY